MARPGRAANAALLLAAAVAAMALVVYPVAGAIAWQLADPNPIDVVVYNTTVPTEERLQQRAVDLVLEHLKVEEPRFVGAAPGALDIGQWPETAPDVVFLVDAYGVYLDDVSLGSDAEGTTLLTRPLGDPVAPDLEAWVGQGTFVYAEFNVLHQPTPPDVSERFQDMFGIDATGWVGRWYSDVDEVGDNLRVLAGDVWPSEGPGLVLVSQSVGDRVNEPRVLVITGPDLTGGPPVITGSGADGGGLVSTPMLDWFSLIIPADPADATMWLDLPIDQSVADALAGLGINARTPMLILGDNTAYFAGNMSRTAAAFPTRGIFGALEVMRRLPQSDEAASFYRVTGPTLQWIVEGRTN